MSIDDDVTGLYQRLIAGWNESDADAMAAAMAPDGLMVGFDGSQMDGPSAIASELGHTFADHETATHVTKVRAVKSLSADAAVLHAVAGMVPPGGSEIMPDRNAIQTVVARRDDDAWSVVLFQNTPARFDGRQELAQALTAERNELVSYRHG